MSDRILHPLTRAYWPAAERRPFHRLALAFTATPLAAAALFAAAALAIYGATAEPGLDPAAEAWAAFKVAARDFGVLVIAGCAPLFALLWTTRLRSMLAFAAAGALIGGVALSAPTVGARVTAFEIVVTLAFTIGLMLALRAVAGVRMIEDAAQDA